MICTESIQSLIAKSKDDTKVLSLLNECLLSFCDYNACIYKMETWVKLYDYRNMEKEDFQATYTDLDKLRTICHNSVISNIGILNRLCQQYSIPIVYSGVVSEQRPHRVEIANAILAYVEKIVKNRMK